MGLNAVPAGRSPAFVSHAGAAPLLDWLGAIDALRRGHQMARPEIADQMLGGADALLLNRLARVPGLGFAVKAETVFPGNPGKGLPSVQGSVLLFDDASGAVRAVIESRLVTEYKTAGDSLLGATLLARPDSRQLLIVGAGTVAASLARADSAVFPALECISVWSRRPEQAHALIAALPDVPVRMAVAPDLRAAVEAADIVASATMSRAPLVLGEWVRPGTHVDLIGAFTPDMREADDALMARARLWVDCRQTTVEVIGELMQPIASGAITREDVLGDLYDLIGAPTPVRRSHTDITVFKNGGGAHLDLMIAAYIAQATGCA